MSSNQEFDPEVRRAALDALRKDTALDDDIYTPPPAIGLAIPDELGGSEPAGDRELRVPLDPTLVGSMALQEPKW